VTHAQAFAKINLGLVVGPLREDGKHEIVTLLQRVDLHDDVSLEPARALAIEGFDADTIVRGALEDLARVAGVEPCWRVRIEKRIPVAAGLGGGSSDAATALTLANALLPAPLDLPRLHRLAARHGADVPFFLHDGAQLATGDGSALEAVVLPTGYHVALVLPRDETKASTGSVYDAFDARRGGTDFDDRARSFRETVAAISRDTDLGSVPSNDLVRSSLADRLISMGAFRADVSGAGPTVYGLFQHRSEAHAAAEALSDAGRTIVTAPVAR
jgi:4-diphosphocytidyl-2-C-methyl-D-erythritol kinase